MPTSVTLSRFSSWKRPDAMHAIHAMHAEGKLPHLKQIFIAFLEGVLTTWKRFSAEFAADGEMAKLTDHERFLRWMPSTNDANEVALGEWRTFSCRFPTEGLSLFNAIMAY